MSRDDGSERKQREVKTVRARVVFGEKCAQDVRVRMDCMIFCRFHFASRIIAWRVARLFTCTKTAEPSSRYDVFLIATRFVYCARKGWALTSLKVKSILKQCRLYGI